jgi:hypothetical protein
MNVIVAKTFARMTGIVVSAVAVRRETLKPIASTLQPGFHLALVVGTRTSCCCHIQCVEEAQMTRRKATVSFLGNPTQLVRTLAAAALRSVYVLDVDPSPPVQRLLPR